MLKIKDLIEFTNRTTNDKLRVEIEELYKYFDKVAMGYDEEDIADPKDMEEYYSSEEQTKYGVLGIKIKKQDKVNHFGQSI